MLVKLALWIFRHKALTPDERSLCTGELLTAVGALPLHSIITADDAGRLHIRGKTVDVDQATALRESAIAVLRSPAYKLIREQTLYLAITEGVHKGMSPDQIQFSKAAIWFGEQELNLLNIFAGESGNLSLNED